MTARAILLTSLLWAALPAWRQVAAAETALWLVSTRTTDAARGPDALHFWRWDGERHWSPVEADLFFDDAGADVPTAFFIHGNRATAADAARMGWGVYHAIGRRAAGRPFRLVIWSWPSDRLPGGPRRDAQLKAQRSDWESYLLARTLQRLDAEASVGLIGYSFGARIIAGSLRLLAGGDWAGRQLDVAAPVERRPVRVVLVAAAVAESWSLARRGQASNPLVDQLLITRNMRDPVLRWYPRLDGRNGPRALGWSGPMRPLVAGGRVQLLDVGALVGRDHSWDRYLAVPGFADLLARYAFVKDDTTQENEIATEARRTGSGEESYSLAH